MPSAAAPVAAHLFGSSAGTSFTIGRRPGAGLDRSGEVIHFPAAPALVRIVTQRLILRPCSVEDFPALSRLFECPETSRHSERGPMSGEEVWARLLRHAGHWSLLGYGIFAVCDKASGELIGETGLADFRRSLGQGFDDCPEATWTIAPRAQGRGLATEAAAAAHQWVEQRLGTKRTVCLIHSENAASLRVAEKLGYRAFARQTFRGYPACLHERESATDPSFGARREQDRLGAGQFA